ncbi:putative ORFan [Tupanvirus deep ocean]|uniref:ORFan n=2 Tax=Tupanvirus TaxID=2094720 RepID=A0AC62A9T3_9VIRU|nr:putative ORFan [Tupanvirus deep ocean]QKU34410.1 putative ORFan [Tupanvirus deep ocean]
MLKKFLWNNRHLEQTAFCSGTEMDDIEYLLDDNKCKPHKNNNKLEHIKICLLFFILMVNLIILVVLIISFSAAYMVFNDLYNQTKPLIAELRHDANNIYQKAVPIIDMIEPTVTIFLNESTTLYDKINPILDKIGPIVAQM